MLFEIQKSQPHCVYLVSQLFKDKMCDCFNIDSDLGNHDCIE